VMGFLFWLWFVLQIHLSTKWLNLPFYNSFVVLKIIVGVNLLGYAHRRRALMEFRKAADVINDFGRNPIGEGKEEQVLLLVFINNKKYLRLNQEYNKKLKTLLDDERDDVPRTAEIGENKEGGLKSRKKERVKLEDLTRYTMVKRIW